MTFKEAVAIIADKIAEHDPESSAVAATAAAILVMRAVMQRGVAPDAVVTSLASFVASWPKCGVEAMK